MPNKYKCLVTLDPGQTSTGWAFTDAVLLRACPTCGCSIGYYCESKSGKKLPHPHNARVVIGPEHSVPITLGQPAHL
jgi:hypothetical protein